MEFHSSSDVQSRGYSAIARSAFQAKQAFINSHQLNRINGCVKFFTRIMSMWNKGWIPSEARSKFIHNIFCPCWPVTTIPRGCQRDCVGQFNARSWAIPAVHFVQKLPLNKFFKNLIPGAQTRLGIYLLAGEENGI